MAFFLYGFGYSGAMRNPFGLGREPRDAAPADPIPSDAELIRQATAAFDEARRRRDQIIAEATSHLRTIAEAADLSVSRVKQIRASIAGHTRDRGAVLPPAGEFDIAVEDASLTQGDRVFPLAGVAPWLITYPTEDALKDAQPDGKPGPDFHTQMFDDDPAQRHLIGSWRHNDGRLMIYDVYAENLIPPPLREPGTPVGTTRILGELPAESIADAAIYRSIHRVKRRLGGVAWVYGRIIATNAILTATVNHLSIHNDLDRITKFTRDQNIRS